MAFDRSRRGGYDTGGDGDESGAGKTPGRRTLTDTLTRREDFDPLAVADEGLSGPASPYPFKQQIESSFGRSLNATAHMDERASRAAGDLGAEAFASGDGVAFNSASPSLHTAAHEAAHVLQQDAGVNLKGGMGAAGDPYEVAADHAADLVVAGQSAAHLFAGGGSGGGAGVQRKLQLKRGSAVQLTPPGSGSARVDAATGAGPAVPATGGDTAPRAPGTPLTPEQQAFFNRTVEANSAIGVVGGKFSAWLSSITIAYANGWAAHQRGLAGAEQAAKDANALVLSVILAGAGGAAGGLVGNQVGSFLGDAMRKLDAGAALVDGMKDLAKFASRESGTTIVSPRSVTGFSRMPPNPVAWSAGVNLRAETEVLTPAREIVLGWQHALNTNPESVNISVDPVAGVTNSLRLGGVALNDLLPENQGTLQSGFERGFMNDWIESQAFTTYVHLSQFSWGKAKDKLVQYGLSIPMPDVEARINAAVSAGVQENNRRAVAGGHGLI